MNNVYSIEICVCACAESAAFGLQLQCKIIKAGILTIHDSL